MRFHRSNAQTRQTHLQEVGSSSVDASSTEQRLPLQAMFRCDDEAVHSSHLFNRRPAGRAVSGLADYPPLRLRWSGPLPPTGNTVGAAAPAAGGVAYTVRCYSQRLILIHRDHRLSGNTIPFCRGGWISPNVKGIAFCTKPCTDWRGKRPIGVRDRRKSAEDVISYITDLFC